MISTFVQMPRLAPTALALINPFVLHLYLFLRCLQCDSEQSSLAYVPSLFLSDNAGTTCSLPSRAHLNICMILHQSNPSFQPSTCPLTHWPTDEAHICQIAVSTGCIKSRPYRKTDVRGPYC